MHTDGALEHTPGWVRDSARPRSGPGLRVIRATATCGVWPWTCGLSKASLPMWDFLAVGEWMLPGPFTGHPLTIATYSCHTAFPPVSGAKLRRKQWRKEPEARCKTKPPGSPGADHTQGTSATLTEKQAEGRETHEQLQNPPVITRQSFLTAVLSGDLHKAPG